MNKWHSWLWMLIFVLALMSGLFVSSQNVMERCNDWLGETFSPWTQMKDKRLSSPSGDELKIVYEESLDESE